MGAGAGSVNFAQSLQGRADSGLVPTLLDTVTALLGARRAAPTFRDRGTLIDRVYDRTGLQLLGILDLGALFGSGRRRRMGRAEPARAARIRSARCRANCLVWGKVAGWSSSYYVVWGNAIQTPSGQYVIWGNSDYTDPNYVVWGSAWTGDGALSVTPTHARPRRLGRRSPGGRHRRAVLALQRWRSCAACPASGCSSRALTIASGLFTLKVPSIEARFSVSEIFAFAWVLLFGPEAGAMTLALDGIFVSIRHRLSAAQTRVQLRQPAAVDLDVRHVFFDCPAARPLYVGDAGHGPVIVPAWR